MAGGKVLRDLRGPQRRIGRLLGFSFEAWIHVAAYRVQIPLSVLYALLMGVSLVVPGVDRAVEIATAVIWVLWTPQLFEVVKGLALAWSRGMAFGHMNEEFASLYRARYARHAGLLRILPFAFLVVWTAGLVVLLVRWP
jgi:hypothetical protein